MRPAKWRAAYRKWICRGVSVSVALLVSSGHRHNPFHCTLLCPLPAPSPHQSHAAMRFSLCVKVLPLAYFHIPFRQWGGGGITAVATLEGADTGTPGRCTYSRYTPGFEVMVHRACISCNASPFGHVSARQMHVRTPACTRTRPADNCVTTV
jgi:hypothetical protein